MSAPDDQADRELVCPACGSPVPVAATEVNPYAPPSAPLEWEPDFSEPAPVLVTSLFEKLFEAARLLFSNLGLFAALILTVWLPGNLAIEYIASRAQNSENPFALMRLNNFVEGVFGPIYVGAMIFALAQRKSGKWVTYSEAMGQGFHNWGRMFGTRFVTGFILLGGFIAFIIPGIYMMVKYSLIDHVVVLEETSGAAARQRSAALTKGNRWQIVAAGIAYGLVIIPSSFAADWVVEEFGPSDTIWFAVVMQCAMDIVMSYIVVLLFLFYWESVHAKGGKAELHPSAL
jgi:hypothetical protein